MLMCFKIIFPFVFLRFRLLQHTHSIFTVRPQLHEGYGRVNSVKNTSINTWLNDSVY